MCMHASLHASGHSCTRVKGNVMGRRIADIHIGIYLGRNQIPRSIDGCRVASVVMARCASHCVRQSGVSSQARMERLTPTLSPKPVIPPIEKVPAQSTLGVLKGTSRGTCACSLPSLAAEHLTLS